MSFEDNRNAFTTGGRLIMVELVENVRPDLVQTLLFMSRMGEFVLFGLRTAWPTDAIP
mgnify:CR=1 FL=1